MNYRVFVKSITSRSTWIVVLGYILTLIIYSPLILHRESQYLYPWLVYFVSTVISCAGVIFINYNLHAGKWLITKWGLVMYLGWVPTVVGVGILNSFFIEYSFVSFAIYLGGMVIGVGVVPLRKYLLLTPCYFFGIVLGFLFDQNSFHLKLPELALSIFCSGVLFFWMGSSSEYYIKLNSNLGNLLRSSRKDRRSITEERAKSERLLLNILPEEIAVELKQNGFAEPIHFESATVLFTDFKGFTTVAESMTAKELVTELDRCFSYFDSLMERYNLEKLKTIGDSYMCAGGLPTSNKTHAIDCVLAALEIQSFMNQMKSIKAEQGFPYWELRLGIHSGPLVAGVIGDKKFQYDIWGDTVNTASRMESSGATGMVNISSSTYELVKDFFICEYRGKVKAKNKGEIEMYFVSGIKPHLTKNGNNRLPNEIFREKYDSVYKNLSK